MDDLDLDTTVYRAVDGIELVALTSPVAQGAMRSAVVFFHGGGLTGGSPGDFLPECTYFAQRGAVVASVAYRLLPDQARNVHDCIADAQAAVTWVRRRPDVHPRRVTACGFSAGGLLAASTAFAQEGVATSSRPDALVLINGVLDAGWLDAPPSTIGPSPPPVLLLHGNRDRMTPIQRTRRFASAMASAGNPCELVEIDGAHTFFRPYGQNGIHGFTRVLGEMDSFLTKLGHLRPDPAGPAAIERLGAELLSVSVTRRRKRGRGAG